MEFREIQNKAISVVDGRLKKKNMSKTENLLMLHLMEESGELAKQMMDQKLKGREIDIKNIGDEISDCIIILINLADHYNIKLEDVLLNKIEEVGRKTN
jgi:NTP pyrophosphatase (non-canonical NTP hydrolase)